MAITQRKIARNVERSIDKFQKMFDLELEEGQKLRVKVRATFLVCQYYGIETEEIPVEKHKYEEDYINIVREIAIDFSEVMK